MMEVGRLCVKIAGRDTGKQCVVVDVLDDNFVLIDGATRRRKCNMKHLEPKSDVLKIKKGASHSEVAIEFKKLGVELKEKKSRQSKPRPKQIRAADRKRQALKEESKKVKAKPAATKVASKEEGKPTPEAAETKLEKAVSEESAQ